MKQIILLFALMVPVFASAYEDHRGHNLDSLERVLQQRFTPDRLAAATPEEKADYVRICRELAWGYLQLDGSKYQYYAHQAISRAEGPSREDTIYDMSILIGQGFWAREQYDSARVYYSRAADALAAIEAAWSDADRHDLEARQARLWGTLGNFYAAQDSVEQFVHYYTKAGEVFERRGWWEDCSILHRNIGEVYLDAGELAKAKPEYELALQFARQSADSLMIAGAMYGLGHWYKESGKTARALKCLAEANDYYGNHPVEEAAGRADTLDVMQEAYKQLFRNTLIIALGAFLLLLSVAGSLFIARRLRHTKQELNETAAVLDETIEELRPAPEQPETVRLTEREKDIVRLMMEGRSTKQIADELCIGYETVLWYRKRLHAKLDVHNAAELVAEVTRRGLL